MARDFAGVADEVNFGASPGAWDGQFPMTILARVNDVGSILHGHFVSQAAGSNAYLMGRGTSGLRFTKLGVVDIDSSIVITSSTDLLLAAVVTSTNVRFVRVTTDGTTTTEDVANSSAFAGAGGSFKLGTPAFFFGRLSEVAKYNRALTDAELTAMGKGMSPLGNLRDLKGYIPLLGNYSPEIDVVTGLTGTVTGAAKFAHQRVIHPHRRPLIPFVAAAAGGTLLIHPGMTGNMRDLWGGLHG